MLKSDKDITIIAASDENHKKVFIVCCPHCSAYKIYSVPRHIPKIQQGKYTDSVLNSLIKCNGKRDKNCMRQS